MSAPPVGCRAAHVRALLCEHAAGAVAVAVDVRTHLPKTFLWGHTHACVCELVRENA